MIRRAVVLPLFASVTLTGALLIAGCGGDSAGGPPSGGAAPPGGKTFSSSVGSPDAASIYSTNCAGCHGPDGKKNSHFARLSGEKDADIKAVIENGDGPMPAWKGKLSDAQIDQLVAHVKTLGG